MVRIAVTGGIACGKSRVGGFLEEAGAAVSDADDIARELMRKGTGVFDRVVAEFGAGILDAGGNIDRRVLGTMVFSDARKLERLNAIVHPAVKAAWEAWLAGVDGKACAGVVIVPLLYEARAEGGFDSVICVACERKDQVKRLRDRGLSDPEIEARLAAQMPVPEKMERADLVVFNSGSLEVLREQTVKALRLVVEKHDARQRQK